MLKNNFFVFWNYESLKEYLFWCLVAISYRDYLNLDFPGEIGSEDRRLTGALISFQNTPPKKYYDISSSINTLPKPEKIVGKDPEFFKTLLQGDGALIIEGQEAISNGVFLDGLVRICKKKFHVEDFDLLFERFFPVELNKPGSRTRVGLALALTGKNKGSVFVMNQTVTNTSGAGRILEYGKEGVKRSFTLELDGERIIGIINKYTYNSKDKKLLLENREQLSKEDLDKINERIEKFNKSPPDKNIFRRVFSNSLFR
jgi:hypothetical protein